MRGASTTCMIVMALMLAGAARAESEPPEAPASPSALLAEARKAVADEQYEKAIERYARLREVMPEAPEVPYDMGVAAYRAGDLDRAAELFGEALTMAQEQSLRAKSAYNLGTTAYARNLRPAPPQGAQDPGGQLDNAIDELRGALDHYRQVLDVDPESEDAKANAELTYRRLKRLEELRKQLQKQQQQQQQQGGQQDQNRPRDNQDQQQQGPEGKQPPPQQDQPQPGEQQQPEQQQQQQQQEQQKEGQQPPQQDQQAGDAGQAQQQTEEAEDATAGQRRDMSREEAERLLQSVRDKERRRHEEMARREQGRRPPVEKDW
jgi:Ca-activated chloride channel family protein